MKFIWTMVVLIVLTAVTLFVFLSDEYDIIVLVSFTFGIFGIALAIGRLTGGRKQ